jgi:dolichol-phosphate mannosyltransferase
MPKSSLSIILPTYNERETICRLVQRILDVLASMHLNAEILVVDDSSPDGTAQTVRKAFSENAKVRVIERKSARSLGASIKDGILAAKMDYVLLMDADFNHSPEDIPRLFSCIDRADFVNGSRFIRGGGMQKAKVRFLGSRFFNLVCRSILGLKVTDVLSGFLLSKRSKFLVLPLEKIFTGYGDFAIRLHYAVKKKRWSVLEIPVNYLQRLAGRSKTRFLKHTWQYSWSALKARFVIWKV